MEKIKKDMNVAVITTRFILRDKHLITHIYHHEEDGMWEFIGDQEADNSDYLVVSLEELVNYDPSVSDVLGCCQGVPPIERIREKNGELTRSYKQLNPSIAQFGMKLPPYLSVII